MSDISVAIEDVPVVPPKEVVIRMPLAEARRVMTDLASLSGDKIAGWRLFGALQDAGVDTTYVSRERPDDR